MRKTHLFSFWVDAKTFGAISQLASEDGRSRSDILRRMVAEKVKEMANSDQQSSEAGPANEVAAS